MIDVSVTSWAQFWCPFRGHQHGVCIETFSNLDERFLRITRVWKKITDRNLGGVVTQMEVRNLQLLVEELKREIEGLEEENENLTEKLKKRKGNKSQQVKRWREKNRDRYLEQKRGENQKRKQRKRDNEGCVEEVRVKTKPSH